jgi:dipeptidase
MRKHLFFIASILFTSCLALSAQEIEFSKPVNSRMSCTSITVGKKASADGSVITSQTCDGNYRTWMNIVPAQHYERDTIIGIYEGRLHTEFADDERKVILKGVIPQVRHTYQYLNTAYPCLNEKQLAIGESTIYGHKELINPKGLFMIEELQKIVLQRCTSAKQGIRLLGELIKNYGFADVGECLTLADTKEVWQLEIFGEGPDKIGGVWAAVRIPDDHVGVCANVSRISTLNLKDTANYMASANVYEVAKKLGYWDGKEPFRFWKAYSGEKRAFEFREYYILNSFAPSLGLSYDSEAEELPFTVKPEKPVSVTDVMALFAQTYEGTQWDITKKLKVKVNTNSDAETTALSDPMTSLSANPWMSFDMIDMLNAIKDSTAVRYRPVAVQHCAYSEVVQLRDWLPDAIGGVAWVSLDNPGQSPRFPVFCGSSRLPADFVNCGQIHYREDAAIWTYRRANKLATVRWGLTKDIMKEAMAHFVEKGQTELPFVESQYAKVLQSQGPEKANEYLTGYTADFVGATLLRWKEMGDTFWSMFARGF